MVIKVCCGMGKGKGKANGKCFNGGEPGHFARDCIEPRTENNCTMAELFALQYKGKGKDCKDVKGKQG